MAKNKCKPRTDSSRNSTDAAEEIRNRIEVERSRLMTAEAVLHCVAIAMDDVDRTAAATPDYPTLIDLSRNLIKQAIDELDSVRLKPMLENIGGHGTYVVKESAGEYVH